MHKDFRAKLILGETATIIILIICSYHSNIQVSSLLK